MKVSFRGCLCAPFGRLRGLGRGPQGTFRSTLFLHLFWGAGEKAGERAVLGTLFLHLFGGPVKKALDPVSTSTRRPKTGGALMMNAKLKVARSISGQDFFTISGTCFLASTCERS